MCADAGADGTAFEASRVEVVVSAAFVVDAPRDFCSTGQLAILIPSCVRNEFKMR